MSEEGLLQQVVETINKSQVSYCKFITANDTGTTGGHQSGFHLHKNSYPLYFDRPGTKGGNKDKFVKIKWQNDIETESRFIYYGQGTRNEYRLTRFGRNFPFLTEDGVGNLLVLSKMSDDYYQAYVLETDEDIEDFLDAFGLSPNDTNQIIHKDNYVDATEALEKLFREYISTLKTDFPESIRIAQAARDMAMKLNSTSRSDIIKSPDNELLNWLDTEFKLFKSLENDRYKEIISKPFPTVDDFIKSANTILNRRKSRAGRSLEHHLSNVFTVFDLKFSGQAKTEGNKKPDFIFPSEEAYHNPNFSSDKLVFLGAKTTCKDRWRQILNEADRIKTKHLFTLQQGISSNQLKEMHKHNVKLVVPKQYLTAFPLEHREKIMSLNLFIDYTVSIESS